MKLNVYAADRRVLSGVDCVEATLPAHEGQIQVLPDHVDMLSTLETGTFMFRLSDGKQVSGVISSGFFRVERGELTVLAETLEFPNEIDVQRAKKAQAVSEAELFSVDYDEGRFKKYELKLQRALIRQQVVSHPNSTDNH